MLIESAGVILFHCLAKGRKRTAAKNLSKRAKKPARKSGCQNEGGNKTTSPRMSPASKLPESDQAFAFGENWKRYLASVTPERIDAAERSVRNLLKRECLTGKTFLDAGSGSGLFSLAAHRMGADVFSFDMDVDSANCTRESKRRFAKDPASWSIHEGSLLDSDFMGSIGQFDIVYCWGVAHHTGDMWTALNYLMKTVDEEGILVLAIYNDEQYISQGWRIIKRLYSALPGMLRPLLVAAVGSFEFVKRLLVTLLACLLRLLTLKNPLVPISNWLDQTRERGMSVWHDLVDWVGGWPFEVARPEEVFRYARDRGFMLEEMTTSSGHGCNEFVFRRFTTHSVSETPTAVAR